MTRWPPRSPVRPIGPGGAGAIQIIFGLNTALGIVTCAYRPHTVPITGTLSNLDNWIRLINALFDKTNGPGVCPNSLYLTLRQPAS